MDIFGSLDHYRGALWGVLGRFDEAERLLLRGGAVHEALGAPFFEARSQVELARVLSERAAPGDVGEAVRRAGLAVATARKHGFATVERRAAELAASEPRA